MAIKNGKQAKKQVKIKNMSNVLKNVSARQVDKQNFTIRISKEIGESFQEYCKANGVSMSEMVEEFFKQEMKL